MIVNLFNSCQRWPTGATGEHYIFTFLVHSYLITIIIVSNYVIIVSNYVIIISKYVIIVSNYVIIVSNYVIILSDYVIILNNYLFITLIVQSFKIIILFFH